MRELYEVFDEEIIIQGHIIKNRVDLIYDKIEKIVNGEKIQVYPFNLYFLYPYLFYPNFKKIDQQKIHDIAIAGVFYLDFINFFDRLFDNQSNLAIDTLFHKSFGTHITIRYLSKIFSEDDVFWNYFYKYNSEYIEAIREEKRINDLQLSFDYNSFKKIAVGKAAVGKTTVAALGCITKEYDTIEKLEKTQELFSEAFQLFDDLKDINEDIKIKNYSWIIKEVVNKYNLSKSFDKSEVLKAVFDNGYYDEIFIRIEKLLNRSMIVGGKSNYWFRYIKMFQKKMNRLEDDLNSIKNHKYKDKNFEISSELVCNENLKRIINDSLKVFNNNTVMNEVAHYMIFPHKENYTGKEQCQKGDVFQIAFILNILLDIEKMGYVVNHECISKEISYLVREKSKIFTVGWSYFPNLPELAPDVDILAEFIKLSTEIKSNNIMNQYVYDGIEFVLNNNRKEDGSFMTWLIAENDSNKVNKRAWQFAKERWGIRSDPEVTANFLLGLAISNNDRYITVINEGIKYLISKANEKGYWKSSWYCGDFYGSYICSKLFCKLGLQNEKLKTLRDNIFLDQKENGSWGEEYGNPKDTAFAILTIINLSYISNDFTNKVKEHLEKGVKYLLDAYDNKYHIWNSSKFIKMGYEDVVNKTKNGNTLNCQYEVTYKSSVLDTAIIIYAIARFIKWRDTSANN